MPLMPRDTKLIVREAIHVLDGLLANDGPTGGKFP
jgi:hypothetical protein